MIDCLLSVVAVGHFSRLIGNVRVRRLCVCPSTGGQTSIFRIKSSGLGGRAKTRGSETRVAESSRKAGAFHHRERGKDHQGALRGKSMFRSGEM
jgi:hypothetical protein